MPILDSLFVKYIKNFPDIFCHKITYTKFARIMPKKYAKNPVALLSRKPEFDAVPTKQQKLGKVFTSLYLILF